MGSMVKRIDDYRKSRPPSNCSIEQATLSFFDIETTGLYPNKGAEITEVAILKRGATRYYWDSTNSIVGENELQTQLPKLLKYLTKGVVVGHNVGFDLGFIAYKVDRFGYPGFGVQYIDTLSLARSILPDLTDYRLVNLANVFNITIHGNLHTALVDAEVTRALFWMLCERGNIDTLADAHMKQLSWQSF